MKKSILATLQRGCTLIRSLGEMRLYFKFIVRQFNVCKTDVMLKAEALYFTRDGQAALDHICNVVGEDTVLYDCVKFLEIIREKYATKPLDATERKCLELCYG